MNFKCSNCDRTFSRGSSYSRHVKTCLKVAESISDEESSDDIRSEEDKQSTESENEEQNMSFDSIDST